MTFNPAPPSLSSRLSGMLIFRLEFAHKDTEPLAGVFTLVRNRFVDFAHT